jgi:hypothetical protein
MAGSRKDRNVMDLNFRKGGKKGHKKSHKRGGRK